MVIDLDRRNPIVRVNRGLVYLARKDSEKAIADFSDAIRIDPYHAAVYELRGCVYGGLGEYDKAIADFTEVIRIKPDHAKAHFNRATAYEELGDADKAAADFAKAKKLGYEPEEEKPLTSSARPSLRSQADRPRPPAAR